MNRPWQGRVNDEIIDRIKTALPEAVLRTTFIVGFPGETEEHFQHLVEFVKRHEFDHVGVFTFSPEEETPAFSMDHQVPQEVMNERRDILMSIQQEISHKRNQAQIGQVVEVLVEELNPRTGQWIGRSARFAPEVDGVIYVEGSPETSPQLGTLVSVKIIDADPYDLYGELVS